MDTSVSKTSWIADHIHGPIALSKLEMILISTATYNRLHNILQNSTLHFSFPSNRTSRFIHSLGCAHLAGEIFNSAMLNAKPSARHAFLKGFNVSLSSFDHEGLTEAGNIDENSKYLKERDPEQLSDPIYWSEMPQGLSGSKAYLYIILYQSVRFAALLHDIGHPPFSHVVESALAHIRDWLKELPYKTPYQKQLLDQLVPSGPIIHEGLGHELAKKLLNEVYQELPPENHKLRHDFIRIQYLTAAILEKRPGFLDGVTAIISGDCDADRLDYVSRDSVLCSLRKAPIDMTRLLKSYQLLKDTSGKFIFVPSTRAVGTFEEFFRRRLDLYKYAIYHHRVTKFDHLLKACVVELTKRHLLQDPVQPPLSKKKSSRLNDDISGLWEILDADRFSYRRDRIDAFIQWDDSWLISVLRRHYFELRSSKKKGKNDALFYKLEELISNKKWYYSLFKRAETFADVEKAFLMTFPDEASEFKWKGIAAEEARELASDFQDAKKNVMANIASDGFFLSRLFEFLRGKRKLNLVEDALEQVCLKLEKNEAAEMFFCLKWIKPGLKEEFISPTVTANCFV